MNMVEIKTSFLLLFHVIWLPDCPDDGDAIKDYTRTENWEHRTSIYLHQLVPCPLFRDGLSPPRLLATGKVWETILSTLLVRKLCLNWEWMQICKSCRILSKYKIWVWRNAQVFRILLERCCYIIILVLTELSVVKFPRKSSWDEMSEACKPGDAIKIWLDARFARSWQRSLVIAEAGVQVLESGSSRS